jgi:hypothetical protein
MRRRRNRKGQSLVEFALALPLLVLLLGGIVSLSFFLYAHVQVTNATREGARAGSLYLSNQFHYTSCFASPSNPCPSGYGSGGGGGGGGGGSGGSGPDCWTLTQWVENALVELNRTNAGCPGTGYNAAVHSFGFLSPTKCANATSGSNCWWLQPLTYDNGAAISGDPVAGNGLKVRVSYRYELPFLGTLFQLNPVAINKTVIMRIQNP